MLMNNIKMCHVPFPGLFLHFDGLNDGRETCAFQIEPKEFTNSQSRLLQAAAKKRINWIVFVIHLGLIIEF